MNDIYIYVWQVNQDGAFDSSFTGASRQYRGRVQRTSGPKRWRIWKPVDNPGILRELGVALVLPLTLIVSTFFFGPFELALVTPVHLKALTPSPQEKADRRVSLRNMNLLVATLSVYIFACEAAFPAPCLSDSDLILSNAVIYFFPISAPTLSLLTCGFSAIAPC